MTTLYEKLGGAAAVNAAVEIFYRKVLVNDHIAHFFDDVDMDQQINKQKGFLTYAFGGPHHYSGKNMRDGHVHLVAKGLNDSHVDTVVQLLDETLKELNVGTAERKEVADIANSVRNDVLCR